VKGVSHGSAATDKATAKTMTGPNKKNASKLDKTRETSNQTKSQLSIKTEKTAKIPGSQSESVKDTQKTTPTPSNTKKILPKPEANHEVQKIEGALPRGVFLPDEACRTPSDDPIEEGAVEVIAIQMQEGQLTAGILTPKVAPIKPTNLSDSNAEQQPIKKTLGRCQGRKMVSTNADAGQILQTSKNRKRLHFHEDPTDDVPSNASIRKTDSFYKKCIKMSSCNSIIASESTMQPPQGLPSRKISNRATQTAYAFPIPSDLMSPLREMKFEKDNVSIETMLGANLEGFPHPTIPAVIGIPTYKTISEVNLQPMPMLHPCTPTLAMAPTDSLCSQSTLQCSTHSRPSHSLSLPTQAHNQSSLLAQPPLKSTPSHANTKIVIPVGKIILPPTKLSNNSS
jgi:hypothetical protein